MAADANKAQRRFCRFLPWKWLFWREPKWWKSAALSIAMWAMGTKLIAQHEHLAAGWLVLIGVGLAMDLVTWGLNKLLIWVKHPASTPVSAGRNTTVWALFFLVNVALLLILNVGAGFGTMETRKATAVWGIAINPLRFRINDSLVFGPMSLREAVAYSRTAFRKIRRA